MGINLGREVSHNWGYLCRMQDMPEGFDYWSYPHSSLEFCATHCFLPHEDYVSASVKADTTPVALSNRKARTTRSVDGWREFQ